MFSNVCRACLSASFSRCLSQCSSLPRAFSFSLARVISTSQSAACAARTSWDIAASEKAKRTVNPIRRIVDTGRFKPNPDKEVIQLNVGDPTVFGNLPPSESAAQAVVESVKSGKNNGYFLTVGLPESRKAVAEMFSYPENPLDVQNVILTSGCAQALELCMMGLCNPGDNLLIPKPGFSLYSCIGGSEGIELRHYKLKPEESWQADLEHMQSLVDGRTRGIILINPSNPCGSVYTAEHLKEIAAVARKNYLPIISDEIYGGMVYNGGVFHPLASVVNDVPIITCSGLAKRYLVPGWRLGWMLFYDPDKKLKEARAGIGNLTMRILGASSAIQGALPAILSSPAEDFFVNTNRQLETASQLVASKLSKVRGLKPVLPQGAMYMLVGIEIDLFPDFEDDMDFLAKLMAEESVYCLPAQIFGYPNFFRIVLSGPVDKIDVAMDRIKDFCDHHRKD